MNNSDVKWGYRRRSNGIDRFERENNAPTLFFEEIPHFISASSKSELFKVRQNSSDA